MMIIIIIILYYAKSETQCCTEDKHDSLFSVVVRLSGNQLNKWSVPTFDTNSWQGVSLSSTFVPPATLSSMLT